jgi:type VI secretion system protein ImpG
MDPRFLDYYNRELRHLAEMCGEFAEDHPKIAGRLGLEGFIKEFQCPDPYVERLLEGFAYMAARVQLKVDADYPRFSQNLLEMVYPDYLAPIPSMGMVTFKPDLGQSTLKEGFTVPRNTALRSLLGRDVQTPCEYRTAHNVTLWPLEVTEARYYSSPAQLHALGLPESRSARAGLRLRLRTTGDVRVERLALENLAFYVRGGDDVAMRLYEQLSVNTAAALVRSPSDTEATWHTLPPRFIRPVGFADSEALLPINPRSFHGYRLLREYFAFPERFMMLELVGLQPIVRRCSGTEIDIVVLFDRAATVLETSVDTSRFALFCTPVINLFPKRVDRIHLSARTNEYHVVPDRSRPLDYEVYAVKSVLGYGSGIDPESEFLPFYACRDDDRYRDHKAFFSLHRTPRILSTRQRVRGHRSSYIGSEMFIALVDATEAPYRESHRQLGVTTLCTNRDLPLLMPVGIGRTDLTMDIGAPVESACFLAGPTEPRPSTAHREVAWKTISHLNLNYLSLVDQDSETGAAALRSIVELYAHAGVPRLRRHVEGIASVATRPIHRRLPIEGPISIGRGLEIELTLDERPFEGTGAFLLGAVLREFFTRYVSINSFVELVLTSATRGEIVRWPARIGQRPVL